MGPAGENAGPSGRGVGWDWEFLLRIWLEEGYPEEAFGRQTARSYTNALQARVDARKREAREIVVRAYNQACMNGAAFAGKLGPLERWLPETDDKSRGGAALLGALLAMKKKGVPMQIERVRKAA